MINTYVRNGTRNVQTKVLHYAGLDDTVNPMFPNVRTKKISRASRRVHTK